MPQDAAKQTTDAAVKPGRRSRWIVRTIVSIAVLGLVLLAVRSSLAGVYRVAGACDAPTLTRGERVLINKAAYDLRIPFAGRSLIRRSEPQRGDLVLCRVRDREPLFIKRVVGVGGDTIELRDNRLIINGEQAIYEPLDAADFADIAGQNRTGDCFAIERIAGIEHLISHDTSGSLLANFGPFTVPTGEFFILGDNRDNSYDSRDAACGCVPRDWILGRMVGRGRAVPVASGGASRSD